MSSDLSGIIPNKFNVIFRVRRCASTIAGEAAYPAFYTSAVTPSALGSQYASITGAPGTMTLRDTAVATYGTSAGPPTNRQQLDDLARTIVADWVNYRSAAEPGALKYAGIREVKPNALIDEIVFDYNEQCCTTVTGPPLNGEPEEYQHWAAVTGCSDTWPSVVTSKMPCVEVTGEWKCVSGQLQIVRKRICLEAGKLTEYYIDTKTVT